MAEPAPRRPVRSRRRRRHRGLPPSRSALALGVLLAVVLLVLLVLGLARTEPGRDVPDYDPSATTTTTTGPVVPRVITAPVPTG